MNEVKNKMPKPEEELIDVLLDFIIVSANLAKKRAFVQMCESRLASW